jgi:abortive infection bacteriophage resistance protein
MQIKPPITFDAQLDKLKARGCIVTDEAFARMKLEQINYYRFTAYFLPFLQADGTYKPGTTFDGVYRVYEFDRKLRGLILSAVEEIELMLRTQLSYYHAHKYGTLGYMDAANFKPYHNHARLLEHIEQAIVRNKAKDTLKEHNINYMYLPRYSPDFNPIELLWALMKSYLRKAKARTCEKLDEAIKHVLDSLPLEYISNWFAHCGYVVSN